MIDEFNKEFSQTNIIVRKVDNIKGRTANSRSVEDLRKTDKPSIE